MSEQQGDQPIFTIDILCQRCEYNLRGLTEPRCPECGSQFDPDLLRKAYQCEHLPIASTSWVLWNMLRHPCRFWSMPETRMDQGATLRQILIFLMIGWGITGMIGGLLILGMMPLNEVTRKNVEDWVTLLSMVFLGLYSLGALHGMLCYLAWPRRQYPGRASYANAIVSYCSAWSVPAVPLLTATAVFLIVAGLPTGTAELTRMMSSQPITGICLLATGGILLAGLLGTCLGWAYALYAGAMAACPENRVLGFWYAASNPFWYLAGGLIWCCWANK